MRILLVVEKPSAIPWIAPSARRRWPDAHLSFINTVPYGNFKFAYPRGLKWSDYPALSEPVHKLVPWPEWMCPPVVLGAQDTLTQVPATESADLLAKADLIVNACDSDATGVVSFYILLNQFFGDDRARNCPMLYLPAFDRASLERAFAGMASMGERAAHQLTYGLAKRYFDWNWNVNALAILGATSRRVGVAHDAPPVSKYALQLLYGLRGMEPMCEGKVLDVMYRWPGTGRYTHTPGEWRPRLGSPTSFNAIVTNLQMAKLLTEDKKICQVTPIGKAFLAALHPDCEDLDLPFRLDTWCEQGEASKPAMDRYLRTFFGKQKRYMGQVSRDE